MTIKIAWEDNAQTIIRWDFPREWTWDDFYRAFERSINLAQTVEYRVDMIPNLGNSPNIPKGMISEFRRIDQRLPANVYLIVMTGGGPAAEVFFATFTSVAQSDHWMTSRTMAEARTTILKDRARQSKR